MGIKPRIFRILLTLSADPATELYPQTLIGHNFVLFSMVATKAFEMGLIQIDVLLSVK